MSLIKSVVFLAVVALAAGTVHKALPRKNIRADPRINVREVCGDQYITGANGNILSPNYPADYNPNDSCGWFLTAENGFRIAFVIHDMQTENNYDVLTIRDGVSGNSPILLEISGAATNLGVLSTENTIFVGFTADGSIQDRGFNASWSQTKSRGIFELFDLE